MPLQQKTSRHICTLCMQYILRERFVSACLTAQFSSERTRKNIPRVSPFSPVDRFKNKKISLFYCLAT
uniref:Uncharacterized protein n=1 Tax=Anguilla anguilla TaxID=7936 RepID=A0A0E9WN34_ANGAN